MVNHPNRVSDNAKVEYLIKGYLGCANRAVLGTEMKDFIERQGFDRRKFDSAVWRPVEDGEIIKIETDDGPAFKLQEEDEPAQIIYVEA